MSSLLPLSKYAAIVLSFVVSACAASPAPQESTVATKTTVGETSTPKNPEIVAYIDGFFADPFSTDHKPIVTFMIQSPAVTVVIDQRLLVGWDDPSVSEDAKSLLLTGFVAGNARSQLISGVNANAPVDGVRGMLRVYASLKIQTEGLHVDALEALLAHDEAGTLAEYVDRTKQK